MWQLYGFLTIIIISLVAYLIMKPGKGDSIAMSDMQERLGIGDDVITKDGILGKIIGVRDDGLLIISVGSGDEEKYAIDITRKGIRRVNRNNQEQAR